MVSDSDRRAFDRLHVAAAGIGEDLEAINTSDEHGRFAIYSIALRNMDLRDLLVEAVSVEEDKALQHAMFVLILERSPHSAHSEILAVAPESEYLVVRSREVGLLDEVADKPVLTDEDRVSVLASTDWLQRRLVESSSGDSVLKLLGQAGNTKRVRQGAMRKLDDLRKLYELELISSSTCESSLAELAESGSTRKIRIAAGRKLTDITQKR